MASTASPFIPQKCGIRFSPPALVLIYKVRSTNKLRKCVIPVRNFRISSSVTFVAKDLVKRHMDHLEEVPMVTVEKMLRILQEHMKGFTLNESIDNVKTEFSVNSNEDLNVLGDDEIRRKKELMDKTFSKNQVRKGDPDFVYDKQVDFSGTEKFESPWDKEDEELEDDFWD